ncbi:ArsR family transcriptional regulator [Priestia megaterium]
MRLWILHLLSHTGRSVNDIVENLSLLQTTVFHHLDFKKGSDTKILSNL